MTVVVFQVASLFLWAPVQRVGYRESPRERLHVRLVPAEGQHSPSSRPCAAQRRWWPVERNILGKNSIGCRVDEGAVLACVEKRIVTHFTDLKLWFWRTWSNFYASQFFDSEDRSQQPINLKARCQSLSYQSFGATSVNLSVVEVGESLAESFPGFSVILLCTKPIFPAHFSDFHITRHSFETPTPISVSQVVSSVVL